jgi:NADH:ubiquinone oxidoreductase subunit 6 (subunit J)
MLDGQGLGAMRTNADQGKPMGFAISAHLLIALLILVITSSVNRRESINGGMEFTIYDITSQVNNIWGDRSHLNSYPIYD